MSLVLLPNTAALTSAFLRAQDEVSSQWANRVPAVPPMRRTRTSGNVLLFGRIV